MNFKNVVYWAMVIFLAAIFVMGGFSKLTAPGAWQDRFVNQWNLPAWLAPVTGIVEALGGAMLLIPRFAVLGATLIVVVMLGATGAHISAGEWPSIGVTAIFGTMAAVVASWSLRRAKTVRTIRGTEG